MLDLKKFKEYMNTAENFNLHNGLEVVEIREGYCECRVKLTKNSMNPQGYAHGSLIFALCDEATGVAAAAGGRSMLTLNSSINFLRPGTGEYLRAVATCVKDGKTTGVFEAIVYDDQDRMVAKGVFTIYYTGIPVVLPGTARNPADRTWNP
ncbi:MAG: PaaI family thioesterase [Oscillospiraceae bacterium]|jgi:acyl-CoA thioesterase